MIRCLMFTPSMLLLATSRPATLSVSPLTEPPPSFFLFSVVVAAAVVVVVVAVMWLAIAA